MKFQIQSMVFFFTFFSLISTILVDLIVYGSFTFPVKFPSTNLFNYGSAISVSSGWLGGSGGWGILSGLKIPFIYLLSPIAFFVDVFVYIGGALSSIFSVLYLPFSLLPYPLNQIFEIFVSLSLGIGFLFSIRILGSGLGGGEK